MMDGCEITPVAINLDYDLAMFIGYDFYVLKR